MSDIQSVIAALTVPGMPRWGSGAAGSPATVTYSFMTAAPSYASSTVATGFAPMTAAQKDGVRHYVEYGRAEGRPTIFNAAGYLAANSDVRGVYGDDPAAAAGHYVRSGYAEGRSFGTGGSPGLSQTSGMLAGA